MIFFLVADLPYACCGDTSLMHCSWRHFFCLLFWTMSFSPLITPQSSVRLLISLLPMLGHLRRVMATTNPPVEEKEKEKEKPQAPPSFYCPIAMELMVDPVMVATGHTYDRQCIERWVDLQGNRTCPVTGMKLRHLEFIPNHALRNAIQVRLQSRCFFMRSYVTYLSLLLLLTQLAHCSCNRFSGLWVAWRKIR